MCRSKGQDPTNTVSDAAVSCYPRTDRLTQDLVPWPQGHPPTWLVTKLVSWHTFNYTAEEQALMSTDAPLSWGWGAAPLSNVSEVASTYTSSLLPVRQWCDTPSDLIGSGANFVVDDTWLWPATRQGLRVWHDCAVRSMAKRRLCVNAAFNTIRSRAKALNLPTAESLRLGGGLTAKTITHQQLCECESNSGFWGRGCSDGPVCTCGWCPFCDTTGDAPCR